jgi:hypothetical protein
VAPSGKAATTSEAAQEHRLELPAPTKEQHFSFCQRPMPATTQDFYISFQEVNNGKETLA